MARITLGLPALLALFTAAVPLTADLAPTEAAALAQARERMRLTLAQLPNYTCIQTIEREIYDKRGHRESVDRLRLQVAVVNGKEMYSWRDAAEFDDRDLDKIVSGPIGTGDFSGFAQNVFVSTAPVFKNAAQEGGRWRFEYSIPAEKSRYRVRANGIEAVVPFEGFFLADQRTGDILQLSVQVRDVPPALAITESSTDIRYQRVAIGRREFLLPRSSELIMRHAGGESRNRVQFESCRQYVGQSVIHYEETASPAVPESAAEQIVELPRDTAISLELEAPIAEAIAEATAAAGDTFTARVIRDVRERGRVLVPKGASFHGRLVAVSTHFGSRAVTALALRFSEIRFGAKRVACSGYIEKLTPAASFNRSPSPLATFGGGRTDAKEATLFRIDDWRNVAIFYLTGSKPQLPKNFRMTWRTD